MDELAMDDYVTKNDLVEDYVNQDQLWADMRQLSTDLKGELLYRPMDVTIELGTGAQWAIALLVFAFLAFLVYRAVRDS